MPKQKDPAVLPDFETHIQNYSTAILDFVRRWVLKVARGFELSVLTGSLVFWLLTAILPWFDSTDYGSSTLIWQCGDWKTILVYVTLILMMFGHMIINIVIMVVPGTWNIAAWRIVIYISNITSLAIIVLTSITEFVLILVSLNGGSGPRTALFLFVLGILQIFPLACLVDISIVVVDARYSLKRWKRLRNKRIFEDQFTHVPTDPVGTPTDQL